jgi:hypothetical protein
MYGECEPTPEEWAEQLKQQAEWRETYSGPGCARVTAPAPAAKPVAAAPMTKTKCRACERLFFVVHQETGYCEECMGHHIASAAAREAWIARGRPMRPDKPRRVSYGIAVDRAYFDDMRECDFDPDIGDR